MATTRNPAEQNPAVDPELPQPSTAIPTPPVAEPAPVSLLVPTDVNPFPPVAFVDATPALVALAPTDVNAPPPVVNVIAEPPPVPVDQDTVPDSANQSSSYTGAPAPVSISPFGGGAFTVEQWIKWDSTTSGYRTAAIDARNRNLALPQSNNFGFADYINASNKYTVFRAVSDVFVSNASISGATWYHIVYSRNSTATNDARLYINNVLDKTATQGQTWSDYGSYYIGRIINATPVYFDGKLAQLRVYKGKALTAAEVTRNWNAHRRLYGL